MPESDFLFFVTSSVKKSTSLSDRKPRRQQKWKKQCNLPARHRKLGAKDANRQQQQQRILSSNVDIPHSYHSTFYFVVISIYTYKLRFCIALEMKIKSLNQHKNQLLYGLYVKREWNTHTHRKSKVVYKVTRHDNAHTSQPYGQTQNEMHKSIDCDKMHLHMHIIIKYTNFPFVLAHSILSLQTCCRKVQFESHVICKRT